MRVDGGKPWRLLLAKLRCTDDARVSYAEVLAAGAKPEALVRAGLLEYGKDDGYEAPGCEHRCLPNLDYDSRKKEGLVGVACPMEPACWPGWTWVPRAEVESLTCRARDVFAALGAINGLEPLEEAVPAPFVPVGLLRRRGVSVPVVWLRSALRVELLCRGLRAQLKHDGLIVLMPRRPATSFSAMERIVVAEVADDAGGDLRLPEALDELMPDYRRRVVDEPMLDLDYVRLRLATRPGDRHVVELNGHDFGGFRKSDVKFLRLLLLAAARKSGRDGGWVDKSRLRDGSDKDPALSDLRAELAKHEVPGVSEEERKALIRVQRGEGLIRLGVPPENIELDASLAELAFVGPTTIVKRSGAKTKATPKQEEGLRNAGVLLSHCRRLGVPGGR